MNRAWLTQVGEALCAEGVEQRTQATILGHFTHKLTDPKTPGGEIAVAVQAVGELTASTQRFFGTKAGTQTSMHCILCKLQVTSADIQCCVLY